MIYEKIRTDVNEALRQGDEVLRKTLLDVIASINSASMTSTGRLEITDELVEKVLLKYLKTVQEMVDTCPDTPQYAAKKAEYLEKLSIIKTYAPRTIDNPEEIESLILRFCEVEGITLAKENIVGVRKAVMPYMKSQRCDMKIVNQVLSKIL